MLCFCFTVMISNPALMIRMKIAFLSWDYTREYELKFIQRKPMKHRVTTLFACLIAGDPGNLRTSLQISSMPCQNRITSVGAWIWGLDWHPELFYHCISPQHHILICIFLQTLWKWGGKMFCSEIFSAYRIVWSSDQEKY